MSLPTNFRIHEKRTATIDEAVRTMDGLKASIESTLGFEGELSKEETPFGEKQRYAISSADLGVYLVTEVTPEKKGALMQTKVVYHKPQQGQKEKPEITAKKAEFREIYGSEFIKFGFTPEEVISGNHPVVTSTIQCFPELYKTFENYSRRTN